MSKTVVHYSEPFKLKSQWNVNQIKTEDKGVIKTIPFHTEKLAWEFLDWKNIYVNGKLTYSGV